MLSLSYGYLSRPNLSAAAVPEPGKVILDLRFALLSALLLRSSSFVDLPPTFCVSRVLACYASVLGAQKSFFTDLA